MSCQHKTARAVLNGRLIGWPETMQKKMMKGQLNIFGKERAYGSNRVTEEGE